MNIHKVWPGRRVVTGFLLLACATTQISCKAKETSASPGATPDAQSVAQNQPAPGNQTAPQDQAASQGQQSFTPDQLDELMAPIALYPDALLAQVLLASKNPQEVLDAGNWRGQHLDLKDTNLDDTAKAAGFTAAPSALMHFPDVLDMMCQQMDWTKQMGQAVNADQKAVMDSVQRLRAQAVDVGNLKTNDKQKVDVKKEGETTVVVVQPANPQVVYVPQYDPQKAYSAPPATPTATVVEKQGVSTGTAVIASVLSFGAGIAIGNAIWGHNNNYYGYPNWGNGGFYYPRGGAYYPPPYRPVYGGGWNYSATYRRPAAYGNNTLVVHNNNYYGRFNGNQNLRPGYHTSTLVRPTNPNGLVAKRPEYRGGGNTVNVNRGNTANVNTGRTGTAAKPAATSAGANAAGKSQVPSREQASAAAGGAKSNRAAAAGGGTTPPAVNANRGTSKAGASNRLPASDNPAAGKAAASSAAAQAKSAGKGTQATKVGQAQTRQASPTAFGGGGNSGSSAKAASNRGRSSVSGGHKQQ